MRDCWKQFDKIVCVHYAPNVDRKLELDSELRRVGIFPQDEARFSYLNSSRTVFKEITKKLFTDSGYNVPPTINVMDVSLDHHNIIRTAYDEGSKSVLIFEDDLRFHKDVDVVDRIISSFRDANAEIVLFDRFVWAKPEQLKPYENKLNRYVEFTTGVRGSSCYALTRKGMEEAIRAFDECLTKDKSFLVCDCVYDIVNCRRAYTNECAGIQKVFSDCNNLNYWKCNNYDVYRMNGIKVEDYAI